MSSRLVDAILVAREFLRANPTLLAQRLSLHPQLSLMGGSAQGVPIFESTHTETCQEFAKRQVAAAGGGPDYRVDIVTVPAHVAQVVTGEDGALRAPDRILRSILRRYPTRAEIRVLGNLNACWNRFVICKELAHLIMGEADGVRTLNIERQLQMALSIGRAGQLDLELSGEDFAWFMAVEIMLPFQDRQSLLERRNRGEEAMSIARSYWVPKAIVDVFFETNYLAASDQANRLPG